jgi:hypothetical protein
MLYQSCTFCLNPESIISKETCCTGCSKLENNNSYDSYFPPPWDISDHPEKTEGWIEFQKQMRKNPEYYLGCNFK